MFRWSKGLTATPENPELIWRQDNAVAVDTIESLLMSWDPISVKYLRYLNHDGLGNLDPACIAVAGKRVERSASSSLV